MTAEELLLEYARSEQPQLFQELASSIRDHVFGYILRHLCGRDWQAAEDIFQEVLVAIHLHARRYHGRSKVECWAIGIARNRRIDLLRRRSASETTLPSDRDGELLSPITDPRGDACQIVERRDELEAMYRSLDAGRCQVLPLTDLDGLDYEDVARLLGIPIGTVKSRRHRDMKVVRQLLAGETPMRRRSHQRRPRPDQDGV
jgi:RNA polymerase sigma-70 factor (ECF subfamily)